MNADCSLSFIAAYSPGAAGAGALRVTPSGTHLVASYGGAELFAVDNNSGALTDIGSLQAGNVCGQCGPMLGVDFTKDSRIAVFANTWATENHVYVPVALPALVTPTGFKQVRVWSLRNSAELALNNVPFFGAGGYAGAGNLYFGMSGGPGFPGVLTANFTENPLEITVASATVINPASSDGAIASVGSLMVVAEYPSQIGVFSINPDGSLTELSTTTVDTVDPGMFSLSAFPDTR